MTEQEAKASAATFRSCRWDVTARKSPLAAWDWELVGVAAKGTGEFSVPRHDDMKALAIGGRIKTLEAAP